MLSSCSTWNSRTTKDQWRRYTPDFVIRRKDGKTLIVEVKSEHDRAHQVDGESGRKAMALRRREDLSPDRLRYEMIFTNSDTVPYDTMDAARTFVQGRNVRRMLSPPLSEEKVEKDAAAG